MSNPVSKGKIILPALRNDTWPHELSTARALANNGHDVEFLPIDPRQHSKSADILMLGVEWEIKSPIADKLSAIERNLKKASKQSSNIIIDSQRIKKLHDHTIERYLATCFIKNKLIKRLLFINRKRTVIDVGQPD